MPYDENGIWENEEDFYPAIPDDQPPPEDPYANWGGGAGGDGTNGSGDSGSSGGMEYWNAISRLLGSAGGGGSGGGSSNLESLMRALGLSGNSGAAGSLLPILAALFGGGALVNSNNKTNDASKQIQDAANKANEQGTALIGGARQDFKPYMDAGTAALPQLQAMVGQNNLADKFGGPVAGGPNLADKFKGSMSLAALARK